ncbi:MAG: CDP-alcohol phosphatidyltransferase family protein [Deltaproteobacteria bacterium]|nr:CDP-alcohol phosphatidyltransferase family protein [Deltaproteobacteria bacterium]
MIPQHNRGAERTARAHSGSPWLQKESANLVSASRLVFACVWVAVFFSGRRHSVVLGVIAVCGAASDFLDGRIARRTDSASHFGRWFDGIADIVFILAALSCEAYAGIIPCYLPALVAASFAQYAADSVLIRGSMVPVKSRFGHQAGILNYIIVMVLAWAPWLRFPPKLIHFSAPLIALFYLLAISERLLFYETARRRPVTSIRPAADG